MSEDTKNAITGQRINGRVLKVHFCRHCTSIFSDKIVLSTAAHRRCVLVVSILLQAISLQSHCSRAKTLEKLSTSRLRLPFTPSLPRAFRTPSPEWRGDVTLHTRAKKTGSDFFQSVCHRKCSSGALKQKRLPTAGKGCTEEGKGEPACRRSLQVAPG